MRQWKFLRVISRAWIEKKPVYLQLPSDICDVEIEISRTATSPQLPQSNPYNVQLAAMALLARIKQAQKPIILIDQMVDCFQLQQLVVDVAHKFAIPLTNMPTAKCIIPETTAGWMGGYSGDLSRPELYDHMAHADCVLTFGVRLVDSTTGYFSHHIPAGTQIDIQPFSLKLGNTSYPAVAAADLLQALLTLDKGITAPPLAPLPNKNTGWRRQAKRLSIRPISGNGCSALFGRMTCWWWRTAPQERRLAACACRKA